VRAVGEESWKVVPTYQVKIDMHEVRMASMAYFDFEGKVEVEVVSQVYIYRVDIRPLSKQIVPKFTTKVVNFFLERPENLSIEINKNRFHNLHLFAGERRNDIPDECSKEVMTLEGSMDKFTCCDMEDITQKLMEMPGGRILYVKPGIYYWSEGNFKVPSDTNIYLAGGSVIVGSFTCDKVQNVRIYGSGILYLANFERFSGKNGFQLSYSRNIRIENTILINPPHYTVALGGCDNITIQNMKSFSCEGWSDGIDMMSCRNVSIEGGFLRTSDDCIAIYGHRWKYYGGSSNIVVKGITLWADVAHPINIGTHGDSEKEGDILEDIQFEDIDILEHHEFQAGYLGCMSINVGDRNTARNIVFDSIRIEPFEHGKLFDFQIKWNPDYNPYPGRRIENVMLRNIQYHGYEEETSVIEGYSEEFHIDGIHIENLQINGRRVKTFEEGNIQVGQYARNVTIM
jgi:hypothetical protein